MTITLRKYFSWYNSQMESLMEDRMADAKKAFPDVVSKLDLLSGVEPKYLMWLAKQLNKGEDTDPQEIEALLSKFANVSARSTFTRKDIQSYSSIDDLKTELDSISDISNVGLQKKAKTETIVHYKDDRFLAVQPQSQEASCKYGSNTKWCISAEEDNYWDTYTKVDKSKFLFVIDRNPTKPEFAKVAFNVPPKRDDVEIYDSKDDLIEPEDLPIYPLGLTKVLRDFTGVLFLSPERAMSDKADFYNKMSRDDLIKNRIQFITYLRKLQTTQEKSFLFSKLNILTLLVLRPDSDFRHYNVEALLMHSWDDVLAVLDSENLHESLLTIFFLYIAELDLTDEQKTELIERGKLKQRFKDRLFLFEVTSVTNSFKNADIWGPISEVDLEARALVVEDYYSSPWMQNQFKQLVPLYKSDMAAYRKLFKEFYDRHNASRQSALEAVISRMAKGIIVFSPLVLSDID